MQCSIVPWVGWGPLGIGLAAYGSVLLAGTIVAAPARGWGLFPVTAGVMHLAWGTGFLRGIHPSRG